MEAAVQAAADWDTYVAVHIYNAKGAIRALNAGVKCLDHGHLINEEVIKLLKEKDAWLVPKTFWTTAPPDFWAPGLGTIPPELDLKIKPVVGSVYTVDNINSMRYHSGRCNNITEKDVLKWKDFIEIENQ